MSDINNIDRSMISVFIEAIKKRIYIAQYEALKAANKELINLYLDIGKEIVEKQSQYGWGKSIVEELAHELQLEFPGIKGFSARSLWKMRTIYLELKKSEFLPPLVAEISWSKTLVIFEQCKDNKEREFYMQMTIKFGWTKNVLIHQIENRSYEKYQFNQTSFDKVLPEKYKHQAKFAVKDEYTFDFLELTDEHSERELETSLVSNIRHFLIEMGGYFTFIGNQYRIEIDGDEFYIDLLLYHRQLRCLVAVELKIGSFQPEFAGKIQFYLSVLDDKIRLPEENPSIGIIICKDKKRTVVEYSLKDSSKPIGVSTYRIGDKLPENIGRFLPKPETIAKAVEALEE